ncbi:hypothetical protein NLG97_g3890 [Lecanicillium saksenae]|uniref:Uncharacterized protein n=1 Tax=Lecanicillium saksenae TaxID=468837 RepID=A0ACC1R042_9HYPO|nr:hypothetical protein NLG97_g3890 [Lecanicillium saksenae]
MAATTNDGNSSAQVESPPTPFRIMNFGVPGMVQASMPQLLGWAINGYAPLMLVLGLLAGARSYMYNILGLLEKHFTTELHVKHSTLSYDMLMAWVYSHGLNNLARSRLVRVDDSGPNMQSQCDGEENPIWFAPGDGSFFFRFQGTVLYYKSYTTTKAYHDEEHIIIKCIGRSGNVLKTFMEECRREYSRQNQNMTNIFEHRGEFWQKKATKRARALSSVIIPEQLKQVLVEDLKKFQDADNCAKHRERDIPYRRGYLLYGPPGTGKSSLTSAIAGQCGLDIFIIDIPCINDTQLKELFRKLPRRCIVLLEDIDAVGADRDEDGAEQQGQKHRLSPSGLLNAIDGVAAQQGRLLIMTTNHKEKLDPALIRPGRIDLNLELTYADAKATANLFEFMYKPVGGAAPLSKAESVAIERAAHEFAAIVPEHKFTVAEIMAHIRQNWESPEMAVKDGPEWVKKVLMEKEDRFDKNISSGTSPTAREAVEEKQRDCRRSEISPSSNPSISKKEIFSATKRKPASNRNKKKGWMVDEIEWLWVSQDTQVQNDIPRNKNRRNLPGAACSTPPPSPCEENHRDMAFEECFPCICRASPRLPVQGIGSFGWPFASTFPDSWRSDSMDDCRTDSSEGLSEGLFMVRPKRLPAGVSRTVSYESCPGLASASQTSFAQTDSFDSPASGSRATPGGRHDEETRRKVQEWRYWSDSMSVSIQDLLPIEDADDKLQGHGANN